jgi:hypothetical protein
MPRSPLQPGPEIRHYHDTLGVDEQVPSGATPTLAAVLTVGNDTGGATITNDRTGAAVVASLPLRAVADGGSLAESYLQSESGGLRAGIDIDSDGTDAYINMNVLGGAGAFVQVESEGGVDNIVLRDATTMGSAAQLLGSSGTGKAVWQTPLVRIAAGVPSGAPGVAELPIAFDSTPSTGGAYVWNGAAWAKVSVIP